MNESQPSLASMLAETLPLLFTIAVAGPPVVFLVLPWLLLALMLSGWVTLMLTFVAVFVVAVLAVVAVGALLSLPVVLYRQRRRFVIAFAPVRRLRVAS
jgi:uncharacterized protein (DUF983 family)